MREIAIRISGRSNPFIHLHDVDTVPRHVFLPEIAKHDPRGFAAAHCHYEFPADGDRVPGFLSDELCSLTGNDAGIRENFDVHHAASLATANAFFSLGLLQPPGGVTRETSSGPQEIGAY